MPSVVGREARFQRGENFFLSWKKKKVSPFCFFPLSAKLAICLVRKMQGVAYRRVGRGSAFFLDLFEILKTLKNKKGSIGGEGGGERGVFFFFFFFFF